MNTLLMSLTIMIMTHEMPKLPYANNALEPVISQQTIDYHYGKHLQTYVNNLNNLVPGTEYENKDLVTIVATAPDGAVFQQCRTGTEPYIVLPAIRTETVAKRTYRETGGSHQTRLRQFREFQEGIQRGSSRTVRFGLGMAVC